MATDNVFFNVKLPTALGEQIERAAKAENSTPDELVRHAVERHLLLKRNEALMSYGKSNASRNGFTQGNVSKFIAEVREEFNRRDR